MCVLTFPWQVCLQLSRALLLCDCDAARVASTAWERGRGRGRGERDGMGEGGRKERREEGWEGERFGGRVRRGEENGEEGVC